MIRALLVALVIGFTASAHAAEASKPAVLPCEGGICSDLFKKDGWIESKRCTDQHMWRILLTKGEQRMICRGVNARGGPNEECAAFNGDVSAFEAEAKSEVAGIVCPQENVMEGGSK